MTYKPYVPFQEHPGAAGMQSKTSQNTTYKPYVPFQEPPPGAPLEPPGTISRPEAQAFHFKKLAVLAAWRPSLEFGVSNLGNGCDSMSRSR